MKYSINVYFLLVSLCLSAQKVPVYADSATIYLDGEILPSGTKIKKDEKGILIFYKKGHVTFGGIASKLLANATELRISTTPFNFKKKKTL